MARFDYPSKYYADDKDIADLLSEPKFYTKKLLRIAKERGIFLSPELPKESLIEYISQLPFSWTELMTLLKVIETEEREENTVPIQVTTPATLDQFYDATKEVQKLRGQLNSEVYQITVAEDTITILVKYCDLDHRSTRALQWIDQKLMIQARKIATGFEIEYAATEKGEQIVSKIIGQLPRPDKTPPHIETISMDGIVDSDKRTQFFRSLIYGMEGLRPENVKDLRLHRITANAEGVAIIQTQELTLDDERDPDEEESKNEEVAQPVSVVKRTTLSGDSLLQAPEFHSFCKQGFFINRAVWSAVEREGKARKFEFEAEFRDSEGAGRFSYKFRGIWERDEDGELALRMTRIGLADRSLLRIKLVAAARKALAEVSEPGGAPADD